MHSQAYGTSLGHLRIAWLPHPRFLPSIWLITCCCLGCASRAAEPQESKKHKYTNALIDSTSPYLLQHAHNPVNWMPWGPAAFAKAKQENKPIFVSIGYSTCYWCHVMERQSFEDESVAKILNEHYIAIKVDREERPDIDEQLMLATQLLTGRGGWPNSIWLTTDGRPWMAATYFPREQFKSALLQLSQVWKTQAAEVDKQADSLSDAIREASTLVPRATRAATESTDSPLQRLLAELDPIFDATHGGFGSRPKFPPHGVLRLLAQASQPNGQPANSRARQMLTRTLDAMWCGGVHDHVGGGFHRYSTDERWFLPHFEKMLYDNGQLIRVYTEAYVATGQPRYRAAVADIFRWVEREMTHSRGGFFSALDSESEGGEEGRFYTWSTAELRQFLAADEAALFAQAYNFQANGNFTEEATGERPGTNIPFLTLAQLDSKAAPKLAALRIKLEKARQSREYPHLDDKILTSWNGLMISGLARAGKIFQEPAYTEAAARAADFVLNHLQKDGLLLRSWRDDQATLPGYLNDYAFFTEALIELHEATDNAKWKQEAIRLAKDMLELFEDREDGGFYFTNLHHEQLLLRSKNLSSGGNLPGGNGVAVQVLLKLDAIDPTPRFAQAAEKALAGFSTLMRRSPRSVEHLVLAQEIANQLRRSDTAPPKSADPSKASFENSAVKVELSVSQQTVAAGERVQVAIDLSISDGYHLYAGDTSEMRTTKVELQPSELMEIGATTVPKGIAKYDSVLEQEQSIYEGQIRFLIPVQIQTSAKTGDKIPLIAQVQWQACDARRCFAPQSVELKTTLEIAPKAP